MTLEEIKDEIKLEEKEEKNENNEKNDLDFKALFFSHPSQKNKKKKDFTEYSRIDMKLLNKKRERENKKEENLDDENKNKLSEDKNINNKEEKNEKKEETKKEEKTEDKEEKKENELENNLPNELIELINQVKNSEPLTVEDFEKYKAYKKLNLNVYKK